ncbi:SCO family protein [Marinobacter salarius]|jgi:protein SCO1|uniref:SCO family protein n=1 Tax=Marinobacter TaxID=2742 RepID=UPI001253FDEE|nr:MULTISPECIES: SCO family protein [Marinobacter]MCC4285039.1 SCO family protein [Marinobacter salarius]MCZ4285322.1 SCO family protein [Marinobacter salarius]MDC8454139.1 SCO family protein [Marinobacter sp. DS40M6]VVT25448.1 Protein SCO1/2 [Marinobacter salarius]VXB54457.1 putative Cytochrome oxidase biogenesis protein Sco1/SenC/PrrC, copper metallochaperone [Marinobacter salarius]
MDRSIRLTLILLLLVVVLIFGLVVGRQVLLVGNDQPSPPPELSSINAYVYDNSRKLAEFELLNEQGETVTRDSLKGKWTFAFVGYTNCPDICPAAMATLRKTDKMLPEELPQPEFLLISADPEHDTPQRLKDYVGFFGDDFHGLTGDIETLRELARSMNAVFSQRQVDGERLVEHSGHFTLINPDGEMTAVLQPPHKPEDLVEAYREIYEWARENHPRASQS